MVAIAFLLHRLSSTPPPGPLPEAERGNPFFLPLSASGRGPGGGVMSIAAHLTFWDDRGAGVLGRLHNLRGVTGSPRTEDGVEQTDHRDFLARRTDLTEYLQGRQPRIGLVIAKADQGRSVDLGDDE